MMIPNSIVALPVVEVAAHYALLKGLRVKLDVRHPPQSDRIARARQ